MRTPAWLTKLRQGGLGPSKTKKGISYTDPLHAGRHPFQTFMHLLCVVSGIPLVLGVATPNSVRAELPDWIGFMWGLSLLMGSVLALVGSFWQGDYTNGLTIERIGLIISGAAAAMFGVVLLSFAGAPALVSACLTFGFGIACIVRARDIGHIIKMAIADLKAGV